MMAKEIYMFVELYEDAKKHNAHPQQTQQNLCYTERFYALFFKITWVILLTTLRQICFKTV